MIHVTLDERGLKFLVFLPKLGIAITLEKLGKTGGDVVWFDKTTEVGSSFQSAELLLELLLTLDEGGFKIFVREISSFRILSSPSWCPKSKLPQLCS